MPNRSARRVPQHATLAEDDPQIHGMSASDNSAVRSCVRVTRDSSGRRHFVSRESRESVDVLFFR